MTIKEYQKEALKTFRVDKNKLKYLKLGLKGESGEVCDKIKKLMRDDGWEPGQAIPDEKKRGIILELGDVMWYASVYAYEENKPVSFSWNFESVNLNDVIPFGDSDITDVVESLSDSCIYPINTYMIVSYIATAAKCLGTTLEDVCRCNIDKLASRDKRDKISGSGDYR